MISKILFHVYAIYVLIVISFVGLETIGYHQATFKLLQAQAAAIVMLYRHMAGV